jgi:glycosyltransferase involved in cell wall biosynthesis
MKVSVICPTFGRSQLLEETIESFLRQDYPDKEMIILNDLSDQQLIYDHPQVKIYNVQEKIYPLSLKKNKLVSLTCGELIVNWDDDDKFLPWNLSLFVDSFKQKPNLAFVNFSTSWVIHDGGLFTEGPKWPGNYAFTRVAFDKIGGWDAIYNSGDDLNLVFKIYHHPELGPTVMENPMQISQEQASYIVHRDQEVVHHHLSALSEIEIEKMVKKQQKDPVVHLRPHWNKDYLQIARSKLNKE